VKTENIVLRIIYCVSLVIYVGIFIILFALKKSRNVFHTLESLYVQFSQPARNKNLMDIQNNLGIKKRLINVT